MRALAVTPGVPGSLAVIDHPEPDRRAGDVLVETMAIGICGTDREIAAGLYGSAPPGKRQLILGHESIGRVLEAPPESNLSPGDLVVGIVRRPDPVPCPYCARGEWDMCRNGRYTERGIKELDGFASERFRTEPEFALKISPHLDRLGVLIEPASVVAKAWEHAERIGQRSAAWSPRSVLVTGAGSIGLLAALMGRQRGLAVHVFDRVATGPKPELVRRLGAHYHGGELSVLEELEPDIILECTGATTVIADVVTRSAPSGIVCLAGVSSGGHHIRMDMGDINRRIVLENDCIFGSVNANRSHYQLAERVLAAADPRWLSDLITRMLPLAEWQSAFERQDDDIKVILTFT